MKTAGVVGEPPLGLGKIKAGDRSQDGQDPGDNAGDSTRGNVPTPKFRQGVDDSQVPVDGQQDDEEDLAVQAQEKEPRDQLTHGVTENPVVLHLVVDPEGQREEEDEVRNGQVEEVDDRYPPSIGFSTEDFSTGLPFPSQRYLFEPLVLHEDQEH